MQYSRRSSRVTALAALVVLVGSLGSLRGEQVLYSSPPGNDAWSGRLAKRAGDGADGPVATLAKAVELSRRRAAGQPRRVVVQQGSYYLEQPVDLGPEDSGLTIEAAAGAKVVLYGGRRLTGWHRDGDTLWAADVPEAKQRRWDFRLLAVDDRLCDRARLPQEGTFTHLSEFKVPWMSTTGGGWKRKPTPEELTTMKYRPEDLGAWLDVNNAEVTVYHMWDESVAGIAHNDVKGHVLTFSNPCGHPPGAFGVKKYVVWNVRDGMTRPGQWYLDRTAGKVVTWPLPGEDMRSAEAIACGGDDHRIEQNRIYRAMQVLHDGAGIYISMCKRIVLRGNYIHDITDTGGYGASAYYLDEQAEDCLVEGNLSVRVARPSHNHMARRNTLRGNVFVCDGDAALTFPRSSDYRLEKNVVVAQRTIRITRPEAISRAQKNVLFSRAGKVEGVTLADYRQAGARPMPAGAGWVLADPKLTTYESGRVQFAADGSTRGLGIPALDVSGAGCVGRPMRPAQPPAAH